jgi:succinate dehydrogenase/fumarate reductase flavoprotein subunit
MVEHLQAKYERPLGRAKGNDLYGIRDVLRDMNWDKVGVARNEKKLSEALQEIKDLRDAADDVGVQGARAYNMVWNDFISFLSMLDVSMMVATSALYRTESRGAHFRLDCPEQDDVNGLYNIFLQRGEDGEPVLETRQVDLKYLKPSDLIK